MSFRLRRHSLAPFLDSRRFAPFIQLICFTSISFRFTHSLHSTHSASARISRVVHSFHSAHSLHSTRHSARSSLASFTRSAYGATRSAPLGHLSRRSLVPPMAPLATPLGHRRLYFDNLLSNVEHILRGIRAERSEWRRRRNERSDASQGNGVNYWSQWRK